MIKTKSIHDPVEAADGTRILVTRYWPRPYTKEKIAHKEWLKNLAPSLELLRDWKTHDITWAVYTKRYDAEMKTQKSAIKTLAGRSKGETITLLCFESEDDPHCHRHILKKLIESCSGS